MVPWGWVVVISILSGSFGMMCMAMLAVGGAADDYREGYQCGRDEACEHVRAAEDELKTCKMQYADEAGYCQMIDDALDEAYKVNEKIECENDLLRQMAGLDGEDV